MLISLHNLLWIPDEISWIVIQCTGLLLPWVLYCCQLLELDVSRSPACQLSHASRKTQDTATTKRQPTALKRPSPMIASSSPVRFLLLFTCSPMRPVWDPP
ncbi:hypothetical protein AMECASPLE_015651 [Ameca splendens]|uniref:Uncharacterized protein n=1 Tax=Ameca splendens TaxID=208324 RepID=A0ABV0YNX0_9TELE